MSRFYNPQRTRNLYDPTDDRPFRISRSKIDLFLECPLCFYLDRRLGVGRPPGFPFKLNSAVDALLKKEFDIHRAKRRRHPIMETYGIDAIPFEHASMDEWRENFKGVKYHHGPTNLVVTGAVDDLWVNPDREVLVVDYKSTSKDGEVTIDADWQIGYRRQMEVYQWLLRRNGLTVSDTGYFVYCNGRTDREAFDGKLEFDVTVLPYSGDDAWVEPTLHEIVACLKTPGLPTEATDCDYCAYRRAVAAQEAASGRSQRQT
ncbi:hypothetical protein AMJ57_01505 [Parcubacteria bacterium SG8_24]|nr:MAG: hypothetical protein AMJ57_01505 [Parcubacteria bacterium SG8_24]